MYLDKVPEVRSQGRVIFHWTQWDVTGSAHELYTRQGKQTFPVRRRLDAEYRPPDARRTSCER